MQKGRFYFISDDFYKIYDTEHKLMQNKEIANGKPIGRPCFYAFPDNKNEEIFWCVPISSKVEKYKRIVNSKIQRQIEKNIAKPECNTIRFGEVLGQERAFLIQNMFPVTSKYIDSIYIDKNTLNAVTISPKVEKDVIKNARKVLKLSYKNKGIIFGDIHKIYNSLIDYELKDSL